jgi:threonine/homoserine/homoserine lactone efflux protein
MKLYLDLSFRKATMATLSVFLVIAIAGGAFLIYFLYALWRDAHKNRKQRLNIRKLPSQTRVKARLFRLYTTEELKEGKRL